MSWLANTWSQVWPNILADLLWAPLAGLFGWWYHRHIKRLHERHHAAILDIVKGEPDAGDGD